MLDEYSFAKEATKRIADISNNEERLAVARALCEMALSFYWDEITSPVGCERKVREVPFAIKSLSASLEELALDVGASLSKMSQMKAGYIIGTLYTALLPDGMRSKMGAHYTPPVVVDRLLLDIKISGFDWSKGTALDPSCGGAAFLAPVAIEMNKSLIKDGVKNPAARLKSIEQRLQGFELDPFAAWLHRSCWMWLC